MSKKGKSKLQPLRPRWFLVDILRDLENQGFADPDQSIDGADFVEYGGSLYRDLKRYLRALKRRDAK